MEIKMYMNKEWLKNELETTVNKTEIGKKCGVSSDTIEYWRKKFSLENGKNHLQLKRMHHFDQDFFKLIDTEHKAYWLGFIVADGCITKSQQKAPYNRLDFCIGIEDLNHLNKFQDAIGSDYKILIKENVNKKRDICTSICKLRINCKDLVDDLIKLGVVANKTGKEVMPSIPENLKRHFIRGFFDGDGYMSNGYRLGIGSSSKMILDQINTYLDSALGFRIAIYEENSYQVPFYRLQTSKKERTIRFLEHIYNNSNISLDRKFKKFIDLYCPI